MRPLLSDPTRVSPALYGRFVRRAELEGFLADHLYRGEPYLALNAVVHAQGPGGPRRPRPSDRFP